LSNVKRYSASEMTYIVSGGALNSTNSTNCQKLSITTHFHILLRSPDKVLQLVHCMALSLQAKAFSVKRSFSLELASMYDCRSA